MSSRRVESLIGIGWLVVVVAVIAGLLVGSESESSGLGFVVGISGALAGVNILFFGHALQMLATIARRLER